MRYRSLGKCGAKVTVWFILLAILPTQAEPLRYRVGTWNLEHFKEGIKRGFPENLHGGLQYPPRSQEDYETIASIIQQLEIEVVEDND